MEFGQSSTHSTGVDGATEQRRDTDVLSSTVDSLSRVAFFEAFLSVDEGILR